MKYRLSKVQSTLTSLGLDGFLVTFLPHIRYLTGFTGSNAILFYNSRRWYFLTDARYRVQGEAEVKECKVIISSRGSIEELQKRNLMRGVRTLGIDECSMSLATFKTIKRCFSKLRFRSVDNLIENLAIIKNKNEIEKIRKAVNISDAVFSEILPFLKAGTRECDIAAEITYRVRIHGAEGESFDPIVASGFRSAYPHARASTKKIRTGEFVLIDFGSRYRGYHSDITRTVHVGVPSSRRRKLYQAVLDAQERAMEKARAGIPAMEVDRVARESLTNDGLANYFIHPVGHGIGMQVHESPIISSNNPYRLAVGNVVTIEPAVYVPGVGGIRIEDDIVIQKNCCRILSTSPKHLIII